MTPRAAIIALAGSLYDLLHLPETSTGAMLRRATVRGESPTRWEPCPTCGGGDMPGVVVDRFRRVTPCVTCGGRLEERDAESGRVLVRGKRGKGQVKVDGYTGRPVQTIEQDAPAAVVERTCDRCDGAGVVPSGPRRGDRCPPCGGTGTRSRAAVRPWPRAELADEREQVDPWTASIVRRDAAGSYHELELCLIGLARCWPWRWRVFCAVHVVKWRTVAELSPLERAWLELAMRRLEAWMLSACPEGIRVPQYLERRREPQPAPRGRGVPPVTLAARDEELLRRYRAGTPTAALAVEFALSERAVRGALDRAEASRVA